MNSLPKRMKALCLGFTALALLAPDAGVAATQMQGYYDAFIQGTRDDETWQLNRPNHYLELRVLSTPWQNVEGFMEVSGSSSRFRTRSAGFNTDTGANSPEISVHDPRVFFNEGHVKLRGNNAEVLFFSSQNRFWFSQPLLQVIDAGQLQDDRDGPRAQALRVDFWELNGFGGLVYYGDKATNAEDFLAGRVYRTLLEDRILFGSTFGRKDYGDGAADDVASQYDLTTTLDAEFALGDLFSPLSRFGRSTLVVEGARNFSGWLDSEEDRVNGVQAELRDVSYKSFNVKLNGWYREPFLYTGLSNQQDNDDERGGLFETWFRLPRKQVDIRYSIWGKRTLVDTNARGERFEEWQQEVQAYAELKGGFSAWIKWRDFHTNGRFDFQSFRNLIFELQGQNKLISVRPQIRLRDYGTPFAVNGYGMEINLNFTSDWKFFARFLNAEENTESRRTFFIQARYNGLQNAELFVEYGDGGRSDRLTENDFWVSEGPSATDQDSERRVQAALKFWF